jgi:hypothetical protein
VNRVGDVEKGPAGAEKQKRWLERAGGPAAMAGQPGQQGRGSAKRNEIQPAGGPFREEAAARRAVVGAQKGLIPSRKNIKNAAKTQRFFSWLLFCYPCNI